MGKNKIEYLSRTFDDSSIQAGNCVITNSISGDELSIDTLDFTAKVRDSLPFRTSDGYLIVEAEEKLLTEGSDEKPGDLVNYTYGAPVPFYHDDMLIGKFYTSSVARVGKYQYKMSCISAVGLLDNSMHYGGIYNGAMMKTVVADIIGGVVEYTLAAQFQNVPIYGWLPVGTRRENLHQLLFATGASLKKTVAGIIQIEFIDSSSQSNIPDSRIFLGGDIDLKTPITSVVLTEHAYANTTLDESVTLYDAMVPGESILSPKGVTYTGGLVTFTDPIHDLVISGGSILESGPNYAVLAQSGYSKLTGKKYTHTTRTIVREPDILKSRALVDIKDNIARVENVTLVTLANSENVAKRVLAFYSASKQVRADIVVGRERPGDAVAFKDPFDDPTAGFLQSLDINLSGTLKASAVISTGYVPSDPGNFYKQSVLLKNNGTWTVPAGVKKIRFALMGGGRGGPGGILIYY